MINIINEINKKIITDRDGFVSEVENKYHSYILSVSKQIIEKNKKIVMLAGPSSSGKTTTAHILRDYIRDQGVECEVVSLDNFYASVDDMPLLPSGKPDFESVYALDLKELTRCMSEIINFGESDMPVFDFARGGRIVNGQHINIKNNGIVIIEGLHGLNPVVLGDLDKNEILKIYISVNKSVLYEDGSKALSSRQLRLVRRICRDALYRDSDINRTLNMWTSVIEGEKKYLYPHKDSADIMIATFHSYEPAVFRDTLLGMIKELDKSADNYDLIMRTAKVIEKFVSMPFDCLPDNSLIREFVPGGKYG